MLLVRPFLMNEQASIYILGLETSCDETAAAIVERQPSGHGKILSNIVRTQIKEHQAYGGVVPELAARSHVVHLDRIIGEAVKKANMKLKDLDAIAATAGPGLIGGVLVGLTTAKALAAALDKPLIAINHLEAHALVARLGARVEFPFLMLLVSGGHSQFLLVGGVGNYQRWGTTIDDALGEAFDKVAKMLELGYPGGPEVEREALEGDPMRFDFPRPLLREDRLDFSFSGLKTAVRLAAMRIAPLDEKDVSDICASFQYAVTRIIKQRTAKALARFRAEFPATPPALVVAGGVAANQAIAKILKEVTREAGARLELPPPSLCTDNGAMVAWAGAERFALNSFDRFDAVARARWPLDDPAMKVKKI
ncbi:N(6)-L-threonylcarbamoyladenine synthase [hydrothermal vent metagenome]|uniref:N(6)-L-threonylcarbamoyladenine synthase n=1 Tax=hydrothermal vent metagenome TaxID=652676 RepID=A0A3B0TZE5_9ZZZZ